MNKSLIIDAMKFRRAVKVFDNSKIISEKDLEIILESARLSPSSFGLQPWKIKVINDDNLKEKIFPIAFNQSQITTCSHLFVICGVNDIDEMYINNFVDRSKDNGGDLERLEMYR
jgi:nitroreductase